MPTIEENRQAISEILGLRSSLKEIDDAARPLELAAGDDEITGQEADDYDALYEQARKLWSMIANIVDEFELSGGKYMSVDEFESNCVADAAFNY